MDSSTRNSSTSDSRRVHPNLVSIPNGNRATATTTTDDKEIGAWNIQHRIAILYDSNSDTQQTYKIYARDFGLSFFYVEAGGFLGVF